MKLPLYLLFKLYIKTSFFFYCKKIKTSGTSNIPKKGAVLFLANHPNGVIDPILIAASTKRSVNFLVKADIFKNSKIAVFFSWLGMMPVYRIRDGRKQLAKNTLIFKKCRNLLHQNKSLLIFPEGTHNKRRRIRVLNKGFTRIVFGALDENPNTRVNIVPVGITYQNSSNYPSKVAVNFGEPILASNFYDANEVFQSGVTLKKKVAKELKKLSVHIENKENYTETITKLNNTNLDFTEVNKVNKIIETEKYPEKVKAKKNKTSILKSLIIINSFLPYILWKKIDKQIKEIEFKDSFRLTINSISFPIFYLCISVVLTVLFNWKIGLIYFSCSLLLILLHTKTASS